MICYARQWTKWIIPSPKISPPAISFNFLSSLNCFFLLWTKVNSQHNMLLSLKRSLQQAQSFGCLLTFIGINQGSIFLLCVLLCNPSLIDISISALLPLRSCAHQCSFLLCTHNFFFDFSLNSVFNALPSVEWIGKRSNSSSLMAFISCKLDDLHFMQTSWKLRHCLKNFNKKECSLDYKMKLNK